MIKSLPKQVLLLASVFLVTRACPLATAEPWSFWEVFEARKLNHYGWTERRGALLDVHYLTGVVPNPELHNYPNHPAPIHWANMLVQRALGDWGVVVLGTLLGLAACIATLFALRQFSSPGIALIGALVFTIAPSSIFYDIDPNQGAMGAVLWPIAALALVTSLPNSWRAWLLGVACFLSGQASWMTWVVFAALLVGAFGIRWGERLHGQPDRRLILALLVGGSLTVLLFALQILFYTPDWQELKRYLGKQSVDQVGILAWLLRTLTRSAMSLGPALMIGIPAGLLAILIRRKAQSIEVVALAFLPLFSIASFVLRGFFHTENWPYEYLVFPATVLTCAFLSALPGGKLLRASMTSLLALGITGLAYVFLRFSNPSLSAETRYLANLMAAESKPHEVVVTNLADQVPPLQTWNVSGLYVARHKADRLLRSDISSVEQIRGLLDQFHVERLEVVYIWSPKRKVDSDLQGILDEARSQQFVLPRHGSALPVSLQLRNHYWNLTGRHQPPESDIAANKDNTIRVARLKLARANDGSISLQAQPPQGETTVTEQTRRP